MWGVFPPLHNKSSRRHKRSFPWIMRNIYPMVHELFLGSDRGAGGEKGKDQGVREGRRGNGITEDVNAKVDILKNAMGP